MFILFLMYQKVRATHTHTKKKNITGGKQFLENTFMNTVTLEYIGSINQTVHGFRKNCKISLDHSSFQKIAFFSKTFGMSGLNRSLDIILHHLHQFEFRSLTGPHREGEFSCGEIIWLLIFFCSRSMGLKLSCKMS